MSIFEKTKCLSVVFRAPGDSRRGDKNKITTKANKNRLCLTKKIFASQAYLDNRRVRRQCKAWLRTRAVPSPLQDGTYLIPVPLLDEVNAKVDKFRKQYEATADQFMQEYPDLIEQAKEDLDDQFNRRDYPSQREVRRRFKLERWFIDFAPANPELIDQQAELEDALNEIRAFLRMGLLEFVEKLRGMIGEQPNGKKKKVSPKVIEQFNEWMELFPKRLVVEDGELQKLADRAKKIMDGKAADDLRDSEKVRAQVKAGLGRVSTGLKGLLKDAPSRAFGFDDE